MDRIIEVRSLKKNFRIKEKRRRGDSGLQTAGQQTAEAGTSEQPAPEAKTQSWRGFFRRFRPRRTAVLHAVDGVTLSVSRGEILGVLGPNGAGKTTLIKMLCGLLAPDEGEGSVLGYDIRTEPAMIRSRVSLVAPTADVGTDNNLTVRENLEFWAAVYGIPRRQQRSRIDELLATVGLEEWEDHWPMRISAGVRQRLSIARSLLARNELVFLDEPTVKLDPEGARQIRDFIRDINTVHGVTVILTTHLMYEAEELCSRILVLDQGRIIAAGNPSDLKGLIAEERVIEIYASGLTEGLASKFRELPSAASVEMDIWDGAMGQGRVLVKTTDIDRTTKSLVAWTEDEGIQLEGIRSGEPNLEDVFFYLTGRGLMGEVSSS
jgi:ABC-2 type transport system ATP-binding protein